MITFILDNVPYQPDKIISISNCVGITAGNGKLSIYIDKEDLEKILEEMNGLTRTRNSSENRRN